MSALKKIQYYAGAGMLAVGMILLLRSIQVNAGFSGHLFMMGRTHITTGMMLIPFIFGVGLMFYGSTQAGWLIAVCSLLLLIMGTIMNSRMTLRNMNLVELIVMLVLLGGGLGLMARTEKPQK